MEHTPRPSFIYIPSFSFIRYFVRTKIFYANIISQRKIFRRRFRTITFDEVRANYPWCEQSSEHQRDRASCYLPIISVAVGSHFHSSVLEANQRVTDPKEIPSATVASANREMEKVVGLGKKRGPYKYVSK